MDCEYVSKSKDETQSMALKRELQGLRQELDQHTLLLGEIRRRSLPEAVAIINRLRSTSDIAAVLSTFHNDLPRNHPSEQQAARATLPPTHTELEFELAVLHDKVYPALEPLNMASIDLDSLLPTYTTPVSAASHRGQMEGASAGTPGDEQEISTGQSSSPAQEVPIAGQLPSIDLSQPWQYCDDRLENIELSFWTSVPISDKLAARAISTYLEIDHGLTGWFDVDLFLADLIDRRFDYCSAFLVSSFLSLSCVGGLTILPLPRTPGCFASGLMVWCSFALLATSTARHLLAMLSCGKLKHCGRPSVAPIQSQPSPR
jgi:hypothetical protein